MADLHIKQEILVTKLIIKQRSAFVIISTFLNKLLENNGSEKFD
jgi:hypothetical protein